MTIAILLWAILGELMVLGLSFLIHIGLKPSENFLRFVIMIGGPIAWFMYLTWYLAEKMETS